MKLLISAPLYVTNSIHEEFAGLTLNSIKTKHDVDLLIVRNNDSTYSYPNAEFVKNDKNCVSRAWNMALERGDDYDYIILPNLDIVFKEDCIDKMVEFAERNLEDTVMWTASEYSDLRTLNEAQPSKEYGESPHFSCFMVRGSFIKDFVLKDPDGTGKFDEGFTPAYFEDLDMHNRIRLAGLHAYRTTEALFYHFGSRTIQASDDPYQAEMELGSTRTRPYYIQKWGSVNFDEVRALYLNKNK